MKLFKLFELHPDGTLIDSICGQMALDIDHRLERIDVILVDRDEGARARLATYLRRHCASVTALANPENALQKLEGGLRADIIVAAHCLNEISGIDLLWAVRRHWPDMLTVLTTNRLQPALTAEASLLGIHVVAHKSLDLNTFKDTLNRLVARHANEVDPND